MKKLIFIGFLCAIYTAADAQLNWTKTYGNLVHEEILSSHTDAAGNIISAGYFSSITSIGSVNLTSAGNSDILVMKTNSDGDVLWAIKAGGIGPDRAYSVTTDANGNSYITGYIYNTATFGSITLTANDRDIFAAKIDPNGNFLWAVNFGGQYGDTGYGIEVDHNGNVIVTGQYKGDGIFGPDNFTSTTDPNTGQPAYDFFLSKLDGSGNFLWTREANAKYDDRGMALCVDEQNNIYVAGQFSDTITFQSTHNNQAMNAGFVIRYDNMGNEIWFDKYRAGQVLLYDIDWHADELILTGDFKGNMQVSHQTGATNFAPGGEFNILVSKLQENGNLSWFSSNFSENEITSKQLAIDSNGDIYLAGLFKCDFTQMNQVYGNSTFLSLGYRDVHYIKYSSTGTFQWARQFGSNEDDYCSAIVMNSVDHPVLAGSFENWLVIPAGDNYNFSNCTGTTNYASANCTDYDYGHFCKRKSFGNKDIFITDPFDISRLPLDYYAHQTACDFDTLVPCILNCQDSIDQCGSTTISVNLHHIVGAKDTIMHPRYNYLWSTGGVADTTIISTTGQYTLHTERQDGCAAYDDTIFVTCHPLPATPLISDNWNYYNQSSIPGYIDTCYTDSLIIWASPADTLTQTLSWSAGVYLDDTTRYINTSGYYMVTAYTEFGCAIFNYYDIVLDDFAHHDTLDPHIHFTNSHQEATDTLYICSDGNWGHYLLDHNYTHSSGGFPYKQSYWTLDGAPFGSMYYWPDVNEIEYTGPPSPGWHTITAHLVNDCADSVDYFISRDFFVVIVPDPYINIIGPSVIYGNYCPGDTLVISVQTTDTTVAWSSPWITANWGDSIATVLGLSSLNFTVYADTITPYVTCTGSDSYYIAGYPVPEIIIPNIDLNGGIVCPFDSLEILALSGQAWIWIGPQGDTLGTNQNVWVDLPGLYHCIITDDFGCVLTSNFVEAKEYSSPFLQAEPELICEGQLAEITVIGSPLTSINWLPPLSGSSFTITVDTAGIYYCETNFCNITQIDSVVIMTSIPIAQITPSPSTSICPGDTVTLFANGGMMNYWWNGADEGMSIMETTQTGIYILQTENEVGCTTTDTIVISYLSNPLPPVSTSLQVCYGSEATLYASASDSIVWYDASGNNMGNSDSLYFPTVLNNHLITVYNIDSLCSSLPTTVTLSLFASSISPDILSDSVYCDNDWIELVTSATSPSFDIIWILPDNSDTTTDMLSLGEAQTILPGSYSVYYADSNCVSDTTTISVVVNPNPAAFIASVSDTLICPGDTVLLSAGTNGTDIIWMNGETSFSHMTDTAGTFYFTAYLNGCSSVSDSITVIMNGSSFSNGSIDTTICEGNAVLLETNLSSTIIWTNINGDTIQTGSDYLTDILFADTIFNFEISDPGLCPVSEYAVIHVIHNNYIPSVLSGGNYCSGDTIILSSGDDDVVAFSWFNNGVEISDSSYLIIPADTAGNYAVGLVLDFGSCTSDSAFISIPVNPLPQITISLSDTVWICPSDTLEVSASTDAQNIWWMPDYSTDSSILLSQPGQYFCFVESNGCYNSSDTLTLLYQDYTIINELPDTFICEGNSALFELITTGNVVWFNSSFDSLTSGSTFSTGALYSDTMFYYQAFDGALCPSPLTDVFIVVIADDFIPEYEIISDFCMGDSVLIISSELTAENHVWLSGSDTLSQNNYLNYQADSSGIVAVELVVSTAGCVSDTAFIEFNISDAPQFNLPDDTTLCYGESFFVNTYYDYFTDWITLPDSSGYGIDTFVVVTITNNAGCFQTDTIQINYADCSLFMPNVFTPDNDGINDVLYFDATHGEVLNLVIQNRWGMILYRGTEGSWDGTDLSGSPAVAGTYFYVIEYRNADQTVVLEQGWFFLQR